MSNGMLMNIVPRPPRKLAGLLHSIGWNAENDEVLISENITLCRAEGSKVERLYHHLCADTGIDDSEPYLFSALVLISPGQSSHPLGYGDPYRTFDRFCNVIAVLLSSPITSARVFESSDDFEHCDTTHNVYELGAQTDFLEAKNTDLTDETMSQITLAWAMAEEFWEKKKDGGRLTNALTYFYYAWRSPYIEPVCLNLAIVLEVLFAPHSQSEVSHQIAYNVASFVGDSKDEKEAMYRTVKKFYSARSSIVHGGIPDNEKVLDVTVEVFHLCAKMLKRILLDKGIALSFDDDARRRQMLSEFLFK